MFDLGGVLIDWNPRHLYRKLFEHEADMEHFLANICTPEWNQQLDAGRSFAEACAALKVEHANSAEVIDAWFERFDEMMAGPIAGTVDILSELATSRNEGTRQIHGGSRFSVHRRRPIGWPPAPLGGHQCRSNALLVRRLDSLPLLAGAEPLFQIRNSGFLKSRLHGLRNRQRLLVITGRVVRLAARLGRLSQHVVYGCGVRRQRFGLPRFGKRVRRILST